MKRIIFAGLLLVGVMSCSVENEIPGNYDTEGIETLDLLTSGGTVECGDLVSWPFGTLATGWVEAKIVGSDLSVQIFPGTDKSYNQSRVEVSPEVTYFPLAGGGLPRGHMQNRNNDDNSPYLFPLSLFEGQCQIYISAWAIITPGGNEAEHFAGNYFFVANKPSRGKYFEYCFNCEQDEEPAVCNSAYMEGLIKLNTHYRDLKPNSPNNWGWGLQVTGLAINNSIISPLYAGAGQNNTVDKGKWVGDIQITRIDHNDDVAIAANNGSNIKAELMNHQDDYYVSKQHVYVGNDLPSKRLGPGQYTNNGDADGTFKMIYHAEVCTY
jgi:hypothetical protein